MIETFQNEHVILSRLKSSDATNVYHALINSVDEISPWLCWLTPEYNLKSAGDFIDLQLKNWHDNIEYTYAIRNHKDEYLGIISLHLFDRVNDVASVGYWMDTRFSNNGYCTNAVKLLAEKNIGPLNLIRIEIIVAIENIASQRVAEKSGAKFEALLKNRIRLNGMAVDAKVYAFYNT